MILSIVIVSYNVKDFLEKCIVSIYHTFSSAEIIVVDNNSTDTTIKMLQAKFPNVKLIANKENKGFSGANNQGIEIAKGQYILLLNPDTEIEDEALSGMVNVFDKERGNCLVGPMLLNTDRTLQASCWKFPGLIEMFLELFYLHKLFSVRNYPAKKMRETFEPEAVSGAAIMFNRELTEKIGGLDKDLFWMEDIDFCYRAKKAGAKTIYYPGAKIIHHGGKSSKNQHIVISNQLISKLKFEKKHRTIFSFVIACLLIFLHMVSRLFIFVILQLFVPELKKKRQAYYFSLIKYFTFIFGKKNAIT